jgi:hypothetical protein
MTSNTYISTDLICIYESNDYVYQEHDLLDCDAVHFSKVY